MIQIESVEEEDPIFDDAYPLEEEENDMVQENNENTCLLPNNEQDPVLYKGSPLKEEIDSKNERYFWEETNQGSHSNGFCGEMEIENFKSLFQAQDNIMEIECEGNVSFSIKESSLILIVTSVEDCLIKCPTCRKLSIFFRRSSIFNTPL